MTARRKALSLVAMAVLLAGGAAAWALAPAGPKPDAAPVAVAHAAPLDPWTRGPLDHGYMVAGILDYRSDSARR